MARVDLLSHFLPGSKVTYINDRLRALAGSTVEFALHQFMYCESKGGPKKYTAR